MMDSENNANKLDIFKEKEEFFNEDHDKLEQYSSEQLRYRDKQNERNHEKHLLANYLGYRGEKSRSAAIVIAIMFSIFMIIDYIFRNQYTVEFLSIVTLCIGYLFGNDK